MTHGQVTDADVARLVERVHEAAQALIGGDLRTYTALMQHADDYTLLAPSGGEPRRGFDRSDEALDAMAEFFESGASEVQVFQSYASGDLAVLVAVERQHGVVGGLPDQDWSLRVTLVFRLDDSGWHLVHRHADPLVHEISHEQVGVLARGAMDDAQ